MEIKEIDINSPIYNKTLDLRTNVISIQFGFSAPKKEDETPDSHMFVVLDNENVIGFAMITPSSDKTCIRARQVSVIPSRQKQGIGRQLMEKAENKAKDLGYNELLLFAHRGSYPFFLKLGYTVKDKWLIQKNGLETILMGKKL